MNHTVLNVDGKPNFSIYLGKSGKPSGYRERSQGLRHSASIPISVIALADTSAGACYKVAARKRFTVQPGEVLTGCGAAHAHIVVIFVGLHQSALWLSAYAIASLSFHFVVGLNRLGRAESVGRALPVVDFVRVNEV